MAALTAFRVALLSPPAPAPTGTIASTEASDVAAMSGTVTYTGSIGSTESADVMAATATVNASTGTVASVEGADVMAATGLGRPIIVGSSQWASRRLVRLANSRGLERVYASRGLSR